MTDLITVRIEGWSYSLSSQIDIYNLWMFRDHKLINTALDYCNYFQCDLQYSDCALLMHLRENDNPWASWLMLTLVSESSLEPARSHNSWPRTSAGPFQLLDIVFSWVDIVWFSQVRVHQMMIRQCHSHNHGLL